MFELITGCSLEAVKNMESESVDLAFYDAAYESLEVHRSKGTTTRLKNSDASSNNWFPVVPNSLLKEQLREVYRVLKNNSHCYLMCDQTTMMYLFQANIELGLEVNKKNGLFKFWKGVVWDKDRVGLGYHYRAQTEMVIFFEKGKKQLNDKSIPDILRVKSLRGKRRVVIDGVEHKFDLYPTEKPVELLEIFIKNSTQEGETVLDLYCGSGAILEAAVTNGRKAIGVDILPKATNWTRDRLNLLGYEESCVNIERIHQRELMFA